MSKKGFTLIELLIVISIIGVLAALVLANFTTARERARDTQRKSDFKEIKTALRLYYNDQASAQYPAALSFGSAFSVGTNVYMKFVPYDPSYDPVTHAPVYNYSLSATNQDYCLWATIENTADPEIVRSQTRCSTCGVGANDYVVCAD